MTNSSLTRTAGRAGLAAGAAALLSFGLAAPAAADVEHSDSPTRAQYVSNAESGETVSMDGTSIGTHLFNLDVEGSDAVLTMYCIDFRTNIRDGAWYLEDDWANYPGEGDFAEPGKVHWLLQNAYPAVGVDALDAEADTNRLTSEQALGATQAAIWHFSNDVTLEGRNHPNVEALYDHLIEAAEDLPAGEPDSTLKITPGEASGSAGETIGEFAIETNAQDVPVELGDVPEGVELVDIETGEAVEAVNNGDTVGFSVPEDADAGEASFSLETTATVETGRLFKGESSKKETQTLITAADGEVTVSAEASVDWTAADKPDPEPTPTDEPTEPEEPEDPKPTPSDEPEDEKPTPPEEEQDELPVTGGALLGLIAAGAAALGAGGGAIYLARKRKAANALDGEEG